MADQYQIETPHLRYNEVYDLISLRCDDGDDIPLGGIDSPDRCPDQYLGEWEWILGEIADREVFATACQIASAQAFFGRFEPGRWAS